MSQTETTNKIGTMSIEIECREDGFITLTPIGEMKLLDLLMSTVNGKPMDPAHDLMKDIAFAQQSISFQQCMMYLATKCYGKLGNAAFIETLEMLKSARKADKAQQEEQKHNDLELSELITRLSLDEKFKELIKSLTGEGPTYQITETVVAAIVPIIEELGWRKGTASDPNL